MGTPAGTDVLYFYEHNMACNFLERECCRFKGNSIGPSGFLLPQHSDGSARSLSFSIFLSFFKKSKCHLSRSYNESNARERGLGSLLYTDMT